MNYKVVLIHSDEGYSISCPSLPGCATEGQTEAEALDNMKVAIREYLEVTEEMRTTPEKLEVEFREVQVA
jgi:predicted RNase H-like HicB family nuclease